MRTPTDRPLAAIEIYRAHVSRKLRTRDSPSKQGGLRIDGGEGGFKERTVSLLDLGWALLAQDHTAEQGGLLDEALVNRLRYLEGTPQASTRWIDSGWAIAACSLVVRR